MSEHLFSCPRAGSQVLQVTSSNFYPKIGQAAASAERSRLGIRHSGVCGVSQDEKPYEPVHITIFYKQTEVLETFIAITVSLC